MPDIVIYSSSLCPYCTIAKHLLEHKGYPFQEINVDLKREARTEMINVSKNDAIPQIFINQIHIGGREELYAVENTGKLDTLLVSTN